jgi:hypothetical protein
MRLMQGSVKPTQGIVEADAFIGDASASFLKFGSLMENGPVRFRRETHGAKLTKRTGRSVLLGSPQNLDSLTVTGMAARGGG